MRTPTFKRKSRQQIWHGMNHEAWEKCRDKCQKTREKNKALRSWEATRINAGKESKGRSCWFGRFSSEPSCVQRCRGTGKTILRSYCSYAKLPGQQHHWWVMLWMKHAIILYRIWCFWHSFQIPAPWKHLLWGSLLPAWEWWPPVRGRYFKVLTEPSWNTI